MQEHICKNLPEIEVLYDQSWREREERPELRRQKDVQYKNGRIRQNEAAYDPASKISASEWPAFIITMWLHGMPSPSVPIYEEYTPSVDMIPIFL
jgi:hypothetical protein